MALGGGKRKRSERQYNDDLNQGRPSPHHPESLNLAQQNQRHDRRGGGAAAGGGRSSRGGQSSQGGRDVTPSQSSADAGSQRSTPNFRSSPAPAEDRRLNDRSTPQRPLAAQAVPAAMSRPEPQGPPAPYSYELVTDEIVSNWQEEGKQTTLAALTEEQDIITVGSWAQELLRSALDGKLDPTEAGIAVGAALDARGQESGVDLQSMLLDLVALLEDSDWERRSKLGPFLVATRIPSNIWREQLDEDTLTTLGLVREPHFRITKVRKGTNLIYRQANYNLLREETEGYAKLITECFNTAMAAGASGTAPTVAEDAFQRVKALVGSFDLDVGRVLDITLDVFANLLVRNFRFFVKYIRASSWWPQENIPDVVKWTGQGFDTLPEWALPGANHWGLGQEEKDRTAQLEPLKAARDRAFWNRVREIGMDAFSEIGVRRITNYDDVLGFLEQEIEPDLDAKGNEKDMIKRQRNNDAKRWMRETKTLPPPGDADAATLLGFKLAFYASSARDKYDVMPENLIFLAALLIKIGFISLRDLYPHLYPPDEKMSEVEEKMTKEKEERDRASRPGGVAKNALAMAGALADDSKPQDKPRPILALAQGSVGTPKPEDTSAPANSVEQVKEKLPDPPDQKISLLKSLLAIGALPEALYILGRFPWLANVVSDLPEHIHRMLHHMLSQVYGSLRPLAHREGLADQQEQAGDSAGMPKGIVNMVPSPSRPPKRWANLDTADKGDGVAFKFYWDDWADNVPVCQTVDDVFLLCGTFLNISGVKIGQDPSLVSKLARIGRQSLQDDFGTENQSRWIDLLKRLLVPALSLTSRNPGIVNEVYDVLKLFPISIRFSIYAEWHYGKISRDPDLKSAFEVTKAEAKDVLKRISKTNVRAMGKALAKVAYASPGMVLQVAINQMESYENLIEVFVECSRYFTYLGYDVLTWCLLNALGSKGRDRIQADGMLTSSWLRALSNFAGSIFSRYSTTDPSPILQYVADRLRKGESTDLEILEQIVQGMTGIKSDMEYNDAQVIAMAGGPVLQAQTIMAMADERHKHERSSKRLIRSLTEPGLTGQLLISVAQEGQMYAHREDSRNAPLKVLGNNIDKIYQVFAQYLDALRSNLAPDEFAASVPDVPSLIRDFGLDPGVAFMICRAGISHAITQADTSKKLEQQERTRRQSMEAAQTNGDTVMTDGEDKTTVSSNNDVATKPEDAQVEVKSEDAMQGVEIKASDNPAIEDSVTKDQSMTNGVTKSSPAATPTPSLAIPTDGETLPWHPALFDLIERLPEALGEEVASTISIPFYATFWSLGLQDILVNTHSYDQEAAHQSQLITSIRKDRSDTTTSAARDKEKKIKAIMDVKERLTQEMKSQIGLYTQVRNRLSKEKDHWFQDWHEKEKIVSLHDSILQNCFLPRMLLSPLDAHYTFMMLRFLHSNGTPAFRTLVLLDRLLREKQLTAIVFECTAREAENFGRFLNELLKELLNWHADKAVYEKNALGAKRQLLGFSHFKNGARVILEHEDFRILLFKWHRFINGALKQCLESGEYMHIRNAIVVLKTVYQHFPVVNFMGTDMVRRVENLGKDEKRADLKLAANSLLGNLKRREKSWVLPQAFRNIDTPSGGNKADPARSATPQSLRSSTPRTLNAAAPDFKPTGPAVKNESTEKTSPNGDAEDGEIDDEKKIATQLESKFEATSTKDEATTSKAAGPQSAPAKPIEILKRPQSQQEPHRVVSSTPLPVQQAATTPRSESAQPSQGRPSHALPPRPDRRNDLRSETKGPARSHPDTVPARSSASSATRPDSRDNGTYDGEGRLDRPAGTSGPPTILQREQDSGRRSRPISPHRDRVQDRRDQNGANQRFDDRPPVRAAPYDARVESSGAGVQSRADDQRASATRFEDARRSAKEATASLPPRDGARSDQTPRAAPQSGHSTPRHALQGSGEPQGIQVNRERLAIIAASQDGPLQEPSRHVRNEERHRSSRAASPRRSDDHSAPYSSGQRDERSGRSDRPAATNGDHAPTGPRNNPRDLFSSNQAASRYPPESSHGRLNQDSPAPRQQQESSFGRLNSTSDAPSGPRAMPSQANGRGAYPSQSRRMSDAPQQPSSSLSSAPRAPNGTNQFGRQPPTATPAGPSARPSDQGPLVHPDRAPILTPIETNNSPAVPSGPRSGGGPPIGTPTGPSPSSRGPPSGPASANRLFAGLQDTLQQTDRGTSIRGRGGRSNGSMMPPVAPAPSQQLPALPQQAPKDASGRSVDNSTGPTLDKARAAMIHGPSQSDRRGDMAPSVRGDDGRLSDGRHSDPRHSDGRHSSRNSSRDRGPSREQSSRRSENRHSAESEPRGDRASGRDYYRDPREGGDRPYRPEDRGGRPPSGPPPMAQTQEPPRGYGPPPDQYGGGRSRAPLPDVGPPMEQYGSGRSRAPLPDVAPPRHDDYARGPSDGRGHGRGGPELRDERGYDDRDGRGGRDMRKRRAEAMPPGEPKRRRSGM